MIGWLGQIVEYWQAGGWLLIAIALVSVGLWTVFLRSRERFRGALDRIGLMQRKLEQGDHPDRERVRRQCCDLSSVSAALERSQEREVGRLTRNIVLLAALTGVAPLIGLLGTVMGMIETFSSVSAVSDRAMEGIAGGISRALITTQFGLVVAIPGVFGSVHLRRLRRELETRFETVRVLTVMTFERAAMS